MFCKSAALRLGCLASIVVLGQVSLTASPLFKKVRTYGSGGYKAYSIAVADVNGDGKPDLLVANTCFDAACGNGGVGVLLGNGDGTFRTAQTYNSGGSVAYSIAVADVNGDGKPDLLVANKCLSNGNCNGAVGVLLGNGDGTFQAAQSYGSGGAFADSIAVADVNGDGKPDLLVAHQCFSTSNCDDGGIGVLLGNGDGTFQAAQSYSSNGEYARSITVADVNGDGKLDLIVANKCFSSGNCNNGGVGVLLGNGDGTFQPARNSSSVGQIGYAIAVADVNGDGKPDLIVANWCVSSSDCHASLIAVLLGNGDGSFRVANSYNPGGNFSVSIAVADVNHDGKPDLLVANECRGPQTCAKGNVGLLLGNGDGSFQAANPYNPGGQLPYSIAVADVNGDGKPDLIVANECDSSGNCTHSLVGVLLSAAR